ncbi:aldehyde dehydrogenase family protein [Streptomyces sp. NPDC058142]|uniref:aldehyde dehydrogenase family protein n=1 Tax=Streptomyces sp. NPDC058142 TaxID=3346355 RepID=UPI0036E917A3
MGSSSAPVRRYHHVINGADHPSGAGSIARHAPDTGELVAEFASGDADTVERAVTAARTAFDEGPWPRMTGADRAAVLRALAASMERDRDHLARLDAEESGKPIRQALANVDASVALTQHAAALALSAHGDSHTNLGSDFTGLVTREPIGVAALITPWNFPLLLLAQKLPYALAAGCTVVVKPSELTASSTVEVARLAHEAGLPTGVLNVVLGAGSVGQALAESDAVDMVSFTGSTATGGKVIEASRHGAKKLSLELGGKAASIVFDDAEFEDALDGVLFAGVFNNGECCVAGARLLVQDTIADRFLEQLVARMEKLRVGATTSPATDIGPLIHAEHLQKVQSYVDGALAQGAKPLTGGAPLTGPGFDDGHFYPPTVLDAVTETHTVFQEEIFGPVITVTRFQDANEAVRLANGVRYGLGNSVWTKNIDTALTVARALRSGTVWINTTIDGAPQLPSGGVKESGYGREMGQAGFEEFTELKTVQIRSGRRTPFFSLGERP